MKPYSFIAIILLLLSTGIIAITCGPAYNPFNEIATRYMRDYHYLERTFFWVFQSQDSIKRIVKSKIYVYHNLHSPEDPDIQWSYARVAVNPVNYGEYPREDRLISARLLDTDDYRLSNDTMYLEMFTSDRNRLIAGWFEVETMAGDTVEVGNIANDTLLLRLIALESNIADVNYQTWRNEWRNVYSLGKPPIDTQYFELQVYLGEPGTEAQMDRNLNHQEGTPYIQILGLDMTGDHDHPDGRIDRTDRSILWPERAYLFLPNPKPFDPDTSYAFNNVQLWVTVPELYTTRMSTIMSNPGEYTKYYFEYKRAE